MKIKSLLLAFVFAFATTAFAETVTIISENFDSLDSARTTAVKASDLPALIDEIAYCYAETQDYSKVAYPTRGLRFSNTSNYGSLKTKDFACEPNMPIRIAFKLASYVEDYKGVFEVTVAGQTFTPVPTTVAPNYTDYEIYLENGVSSSTFSFTMTVPSGTKSSYKSCVAIDDLVITQDIIDPDVPAVQLAAPADIAAEVTYESATVSWTEVDNATKYSVIFVNGETETEYETTETSITFENLSAETAYSVKVAAVGNDVSYLTSEYSTASFTTEAAPEGGWNVLFYDDLSKVDSGNHTNTNHSAVKAAQVPWAKLETDGVDYSKVYAAGGALKFSTGSAQGYITTTNITFQALKTRITAYVKGWNQKDGTPKSFDVVINGQTYSEPFPQAYITSDFAEVVIEIPSVTAGSFPVKITSTKGDDYRFFLDSFKIEQFVSESMTTLPAPTSVEAAAQTPYSVKVNWSAVAGASSYTVTLQKVDEEGNSVGSSIVNAAGNTETSIVVDGLADGVSYNVSVVAVGDDKILSSEATTISITTPLDTYKPVFTITNAAGEPANAFTAPLTDPIVVNASAMVGEEAAEVAVEGAPDGATFVDGVFTWTPEGVKVGTTVTLNFSVTNEGGTYTTSVTITVAEALPLVVGEITVSDIKATGATLSWDALPKATSYTYDIWYGSSIVTNGVDMETFFDFEGVRKGVIPFDVTINGANGTYADNKDFDFDHNVICFNDDTGYVITKQYPKAVTNLSAYFVKKSAGTEEGFTGNPVTVYASSDDGATWVQVASYAAADLAADEVRVFEFDAALNYTRFKFEWQKVEMNFGISGIAATYTGAGVKMFAENQTTTDTTITIPKGLVANTEYIVRIKASNDAGDSAYQYLRFATEKADSATVIIIQ